MTPRDRAHAAIQDALNDEIVGSYLARHHAWAIATRALDAYEDQLQQDAAEQWQQGVAVMLPDGGIRVLPNKRSARKYRRMYAKVAGVDRGKVWIVGAAQTLSPVEYSLPRLPDGSGLCSRKEHTMKRSPSEIDSQLNDAAEGMDSGSKWPGMSYEQGVYNALNWVLGNDDVAPMNDEDN